MIKFCEYGFVFLIGGVGYSLIELGWRGYTHWSMALAGGVCLMILYGIQTSLPGGWLLRKGLMAALAVTGVEFFTGLLVNCIFRWNVWDYSELPGNILGQVCPLYTCFWFVLSIPLFWFCGGIQKLFFKNFLSESVDIG